MARIPNPDDMTRAVPQVGARRINVPTPDYVDQTGAGIVDVGNSLFKVGVDLGRLNAEREERESRLAIAKARSQFTIKALSVEQASTSDGKYQEYGKRYEEGIKKARDNALAMVPFVEDHEVLALEFDEQITRGALRITNKSQVGEKDKGRADLDRELETGLRSLDEEGLDTPSRVQILKSAQLMIQAAKENQYLTEQEARAKESAYKERYALARITGMTDEGKLAAIKQKQPWLEFLPPVKLAGIKQRAMDVTEEDTTRQKAQNIYDTTRLKLDSYTERRDHIEKIKDAKVRARAHQLNDQDYNRDQAIERDAREDDVQQAVEFANTGDGKVPSELWTRLDNAAQASVRQIQQRRASPAPPTFSERVEESQAYQDFKEIAATYPADLVNRYTRADIEAKLPPGTQRDDILKARTKALESIRKGAVAEVDMTEAQINRYINQTADQLELIGTGKKKRRALLAGSFDRMVRAKKLERPGSVITQADLDEIQKTLTQEIVTNERFYWKDEVKRFYRLTDEDLKTLPVPDEEEKKIRAGYAEALKQKPDLPKLTDELIREVYIESLSQ